MSRSVSCPGQPLSPKAHKGVAKLPFCASGLTTQRLCRALPFLYFQVRLGIPYSSGVLKFYGSKAIQSGQPVVLVLESGIHSSVTLLLFC